MHETALETRYGALGRAHPTPDFLLRQAGSDTGCDKFIGQTIERLVRIPTTSKGRGSVRFRATVRFSRRPIAGSVVENGLIGLLFWNSS